MKALTIMQPHASLVSLKLKRYETRTWFTHYRGPLAIHAALKFPYPAQRLARSEPFVRAFCGTKPEDLPVGCIIAVCHLMAVFPTIDFTGQSQFEFSNEGDLKNELAFGDFSPGRHAWLLTNVRALEKPIPARGALGLWEWNGEASLLEQEINIHEKTNHPNDPIQTGRRAA